MNLNFSEESPEYRSVTGSFFTCIIVAVMILYTCQEAIVMHHREGTLYTSTTINNADDRRVFTAEDGFNIAIAIYDE